MKKIFLLIIYIFSFIVSNAQYFTWAKANGGIGTDWAMSHVTDAAGNVYITGTFNNTIDLDPGPGIQNFTSAGSMDIFIQKLDVNGNLLWAGTIGGTAGDYSTSIALDTANNMYIYGSFYGTCDFYPTSFVYNVPATNPTLADGFILKLDTDGNWGWLKHFGGPGISNVTAENMIISRSGFIYTLGEFAGTVDFDPGGGSFPITTASTHEMFVQKLDLNGNFIWAKSFTGTGGGTNRPQTLATNLQGNIYITGPFSGTADLDPGPGTYPLISAGGLDIFVAKIDSSGNFNWAKSIGRPSDDYSYAITADDSGNVYTTGNASPSMDFDPGTGVFLLPGNDAIFIQKLNASGNFVWAKGLGGSCNERPSSITLDATGNIYTSGYFDSDSADFDPGLGIRNLKSHTGGTDIFISKLNNVGNYVWAKSLDGKGNYDDATTLTVDPSGNILVSGYYSDSTDFNPGGGNFSITCNGNFDAYTLKLSQDACSSITLIMDSVNSSSCLASGYATAHAINGQAPYSYLWNVTPPITDSSASLFAGIRQLTVTDSNGCVRTNSVLVNGPPPYSSFDLNANMVTPGFRPGYHSIINLDVFNNACSSVSGNVKLILPSGVTYFSSTPAPTSIIGDTLRWNLGVLTYDSTHFKPVINVVTSSAVTLGTLLCFDLLSSPIIGDSDTTNNVKNYCFNAVNSLDPNIKSVNPQGECNVGLIKADQKLTYTIQFQNTGSADAINIYVLDTLDTDLNINSIQIDGSSHAEITEVLPGNVLKFRFDNIHLADSTSNEPLSHGYVIFEIMPVISLPNGTTIMNKAGIYFDFNSPVYTNTALNTISDGIINTGITLSGSTITSSQTGGIYQWLDCNAAYNSISGATGQNFTPGYNGNFAVSVSNGCQTDTSICVQILTTGINDFSNSIISIYPNPTNSSFIIEVAKPTELKIINMLGGIVIDTKVKNKDVIDISILDQGVYFIRITEGNTIKLIKQ